MNEDLGMIGSTFDKINVSLLSVADEESKAYSKIALGFSRRLPHGTRMSAGCGKHWNNLCGARQGG